MEEVLSQIEKQIENKRPYIVIETEGKLVGSPYPWRREFVIRIKAKTLESKTKRLNEWLREFLSALKNVYEDLVYDDLPSLYEYAVSFCKYCALKQNPYGSLCFRHHSISEAIHLIGAESNHVYRYEFFLEPIIAKLALGANRWEIFIAPDIAIIKRPSGIAFTLRARPNQVTSHLLLSRKLVSFLDFIIKYSYYSFEFSFE